MKNHKEYECTLHITQNYGCYELTWEVFKAGIQQLETYLDDLFAASVDCWDIPEENITISLENFKEKKQ